MLLSRPILDVMDSTVFGPVISAKYVSISLSLRPNAQHSRSEGFSKLFVNNPFKVCLAFMTVSCL